MHAPGLFHHYNHFGTRGRFIEFYQRRGSVQQWCGSFSYNISVIILGLKWASIGLVLDDFTINLIRSNSPLC